MKRKNEHNTVDIFNSFCKERHAEDKGKNYNLLQEVYANTELFDLSHYEGKPLQDRWELLDVYKSDYIMYSKYLKDLALPFSNCFCKIIGTDEILVYVFIREYEPQINTGTFHIKVTGSEIQIPFTIYTEGGYIAVQKGLIDLMEQHFGKLPNKADYMNFVLDTVVTLCNLPKSVIVSDTPIRKVEYYPRKKANTIKVVNRPIYYIIGKKGEQRRNAFDITPRGKLEITHSFKVRGHWRHLAEKQLGKDRNGERKIKGFTWISEHVRGTGELVKRVRKVK